MKCQYCNGTGEHINDANRMTTCEFCGGTGVIKPLTNEEWLKSLNTKELAKWIRRRTHGNDEYNEEVELAWEKWLKEKHNG